jgi:hypothetical protein
VASVVETVGRRAPIRVAQHLVGEVEREQDAIGADLALVIGEMPQQRVQATVNSGDLRDGLGRAVKAVRFQVPFRRSFRQGGVGPSMRTHRSANDAREP